MTPAACYLAEVRYDPNEAPELCGFTPSQLTAFLSRNIEHHHYSGDSYEVVRLFRYESGTLTPLTLHGTGEDRDGGDWLSWHYEVCDPVTLHSDGSHVTELAF